MLGKKPRYTQKELNSIRTKKTLYKVAINLFKEYGYENVKVEDITRVAGTSKGAFYTHFSSKTQILFEYYAQIDKYYLDLEKDLVNIEGAIDKLVYFVIKQADYIENIITVDICRVLYMYQIDKNNPGSAVLQKSRPHLRIIKEIIAEGQKAGEIIDSVTSDEFVKYIMNIIRGFVYNWILFEGSESLSEEAKKYYPLMFRSFLNYQSPQ